MKQRLSRKIVSLGFTYIFCIISSMVSVNSFAQSTVDVMVLYTSDAARERNGAIDTYINSLIEFSNTSYEDSQMDLRIRLVHSQQLNVRGVNAIDGGSLDALRRDAQVNELRAEYGADLVAILIPAQRGSGGTVCGIGYVGSGRNGQLSRFAKNSAFSISGSNCGATTFAHELGHNMGLGHSRRQNSSGGVFDFGVGYGVQNNFSTIMAYSQVFNARRVNRFSSPDQTCRGVPCEVSRNSGDGSDSVFAVNAVARQLADFLPSNNNGGGGGGGGSPAPEADPVRPVPNIANNLVENASFEEGQNAWLDKFNSSSLRIDNIRRYTGEQSLLVNNRGFFYSGASQDLLGRLSDGDTYKISAAMRLQGDGSDQGRMAIGITDDQGRRYITFDRVGISGNEWNEISGEFTLQAEGRIRELFVHFYGPSEDKNFYLDQVSIVPVKVNQPGNGGGNTSPNVVLNGNFEDGTSANWETGFYGSIGAISEAQQEGNYSLRTFSRAVWYDGPMQRITSRVASNKVYQLSAWTRLTDVSRGEQNVEARLFFRDDRGSNWQRFDIKRVGLNWTELSGAISVQATGEIQDARLYFFGPQRGVNFIIDNVVLEEQ